MTHKYYEQLDSNKAKTPKRNILVVQGDWNAKVGLEAYQHWEGTVGRFGIGETNVRGWRLLGISRSHPLHLPTLSTPTSRPEQQHGMPLMVRFTTR